MALACHPQIDFLDRIAHAHPQAVDRLFVADIAVGSGLSRPDVLVVLRLQDRHGLIQPSQILVERRQPFVILGLEGPGQCALETPEASLQ